MRFTSGVRNFGKCLKRNFIYILLSIFFLTLLFHDRVFWKRKVISTDGDTVVAAKYLKNNVVKTMSKEEVTSKKIHISEILEQYPTEGYNRADFLRRACEKISTRKRGLRVRVSYDSNNQALYCPLCKLASTFWTRVFKMLEWNGKGKGIRHPFEVSISDAKKSNLYFDTGTNKVTGFRASAKDSFRFLFVRNPYSLLFSAFTDKLVGPNPSYWNLFKSGGNICSDITFEQFLRHIVDLYKKKRPQDCHVSGFDSCKPCHMNYTFVAKMETFKEDTFHILSKLNQTQTLEVFKEEFSRLHAEDAIDDSTSGPYSWKKEILKYMPWNKALQRIWRKLQIRGIIGMQGFPLDDEAADDISKEDFIKIVNKARLESKPQDLKWQKVQAFKEAYADIPTDILQELRKLYVEEFKLFEYDDMTEEVYKREESFRKYGFMEYDNIKESFSYPNK